MLKMLTKLGKEKKQKDGEQEENFETGCQSQAGPKPSSTNHGQRRPKFSEFRKKTEQKGKRLNSAPDASNLDEHLSVAVFTNNLIWEKIAYYLSISDLKITRQTCKLLLEKVNNYTRFSNSLELTICDETWEENVLVNSTFPWKKSKVVDISVENVSSLTQLFENLEHLELCNMYPEQKISMILSTVPPLKSLTLDMRLLQRKVPINELSAFTTTLEHFCISSCSCGIFDDDVFQENMENISSIGMKLKSIELRSQVINMNLRNTALFQKIFETNSERLEKIKATWLPSIIDCIADLKFPCLKEVEINLDFVKMESKFIDFLNNQPLLKRMCIYSEVSSSSETRHISDSVLQCIKDRSSKLEVLQLGGVGWMASFPNSESWTFLNTLNLKTFLIDGTLEKGMWYRPFDPFQCRNMTEVCMAELPSTIKTLSIINIERSSNSDHSDWEERTASWLNKFVNLTILELIKSKNCLSDSILQSIYSNLTQLKIFKFGGSMRITDYGLTGRRDGFIRGVSLKNLKGLLELQILDCKNVTEEGVCLALEFQELVIADLRCGFLLSDLSLVQIAKQNPSLESITRYLEVGSFVRPAYEFFNIIPVNPRLTRVSNRYLPRTYSKRSQGRHSTSYRPSYGVLSQSPAVLPPVSGFRSAYEFTEAYRFEIGG